MRLYLVQHGEARSEAEDPERSLTIRGEEETRKISGAAKRQGIRPSRIYHSGKKRAEQTAGIIARVLDLSVQLGQGLNPNNDVRPWVERVSGETEGLMIVGPPAVPGKACLLSCLRGRGFKSSRVSIQRHPVFGKERARKMGSGLGSQTGNGLRDSFLIVPVITNHQFCL
ncbi:MAG: histidine phosphatase family protein [Thermodesulfobacteriota bacterium]